jgi:hypothetical protein
MPITIYSNTPEIGQTLTGYKIEIDIEVQMLNIDISQYKIASHTPESPSNELPTNQRKIAIGS